MRPRHGTALALGTAMHSARLALDGAEALEGTDSRSPLWLLTREPRLNALVARLDDARRRIEADPNVPFTLVFDGEEVAAAREAFGRMIIRGEASLHRLAELLAADLFGGAHLRHAVVVGSRPNGERLTVARPVVASELYGQTDLDLAEEILASLSTGSGAELPRLVASFVEYQALDHNRWQIHRLVTRIKAEEAIWNKVVDELFGLDSLVHADKKLRAMSRFVKDLFGLKIVVSDEMAARRLQRRLRDLRFDEKVLSARRVAAGAATERIEILEEKDYLGPERKRSGWASLKLVARWDERLFEIQIQPLDVHLRERERLTLESHEGFKARREAVREEVARQVPLFGFYRDLLRWLFVPGESPPPTFGRVRVIVEGSPTPPSPPPA
jgi:hypothetical protein